MCISATFFMQAHIYTVSELAQKVKQIVEQYLTTAWVAGEVSNYSRSRAGHIYFSLKDETASIKCVLWRQKADQLPFQLTDGMHLKVWGQLTTYPAQSQYQISVAEIRPAGMGTLYMAFEALKNRLTEEGLFAEDLKQPVPRYPARIGVVTSATGAAIRDILNISERRNPAVEIVIYPAMVQGEKAADTIVEGIRTFNRLHNVDLIIIGRGGGSLEDLWAFNEEKVVREIVASQLPVVSGVGHEVDYTLADFAADLRAPTPSAAAELTIPSAEELQTHLNQIQKRMTGVLANQLKQLCYQQSSAHKKLVLLSPQATIRQHWQRLDDLGTRLTITLRQILKAQQQDLRSIQDRLSDLNPKAVLQRGFALVYKQPQKRLVKSISQVDQNDKIMVEVADGSFPAQISGRPKSAKNS